MTKKEKIRKVGLIMIRLYAENRKAGADHQKAQEQVFNRMNAEHPEILNWWINERMAAR